jgi:hypothetical protein
MTLAWIIGEMCKGALVGEDGEVGEHGGALRGEDEAKDGV